MDNNEKDIFSVIGRLPAYSKLLIKLYRSREISKRHKLTLSMGIAYSISPFDFIPGIIPVAGQLDNLIIMLRCLDKVLKATDAGIRDKFLSAEGITMEQIGEDIELSRDTLKAIGRGTVKVISNTAKFIGYSTLYGLRKLRKKEPF